MVNQLHWTQACRRNTEDYLIKWSADEEFNFIFHVRYKVECFIGKVSSCRANTTSGILSVRWRVDRTNHLVEHSSQYISGKNAFKVNQIAPTTSFNSCVFLKSLIDTMLHSVHSQDSPLTLVQSIKKTFRFSKARKYFFVLQLQSADHVIQVRTVTCRKCNICKLRSLKTSQCLLPWWVQQIFETWRFRNLAWTSCMEIKLIGLSFPWLETQKLQLWHLWRTQVEFCKD